MNEMLSKEETDRFVDVGGIRIHYNEAGRGPALICTHGGGPGANAWDNTKYIFGPLSEHFRTILLDCPGWGESQKDVNTGGVPLDIFMARLLRDFMDTVGIDRAHQYGSSLFGPAVVRFGIEFPDRTGKLVIQSSEVGPPRAEVPEGIKALRAFGADPTMANMEQMYRHFTPREEFRSPAEITARFEKAMTPGHLDARREMTSVPNSNLMPELHRLQAEALVVWGVEDGMVPVDAALDLLRNLPRSRAVIWGDHSGHFVIAEHSAEVARTIIDFLAD